MSLPPFFLLVALTLSLLIGASAAAEKPLPTGFMLRGTPNMKVRPMRGTRSGFIPPCKGVDSTLVFAEWADMQPEKFGPIADRNIVDQALTALSEWNRQHPTDPVRLRLRTLSGIYSPDWVMFYAGSAQIDYRRREGDKAIIRTTPRFWTRPYRDAWEDFQKKMAEKYDLHPLISDVSISGCMTLHSEVLWRQFGHPQVLSGLVHAGLTDEADVDCLKWDIGLFMEQWRETPVEMTLNSRRTFSLEDGELRLGRLETSVARDLMNHMATEAKRLNKSYMVGNHSLSDYSVISNRKYEDSNHILYALRKEHHDRKTPLYFQTEVFTADIVESLLTQGIKLGASLVELPNDITPAQINSPAMQTLRTRLKEAQ